MSANGIRHFLDLIDIPSNELRGIVAASRGMKSGGAHTPKPLAGKTLAMVFDKPSTRTRVSFDVGIRQLGGELITLTGAEMQLRARRDHCRHRARPVALRRWHRHPHARPQDCG